MKDQGAIRKDLVLVGGGHSHAIALRMFGMKPIPGVRITLISDASETPYSGMLPGHVAGFYAREDCHINLRSLCQFAGAQLIVDAAIGLDLENQRVLCANYPAIAFDVVSIDIGSTPKIPAIAGAHSIGAKPIAQFLDWWDQFSQAGSESVAIVGGGTGGVELALNMQRRLPSTTIHLFQRDAELMPRHSAWIRRHFRRLLIQRNIQLHLNETVREVQDRSILCESGLMIAADTILWVTEATTAHWIAESGLKTDADGFILVNDALQSISHPNVFAAGDIATMINHSRPKAGVFAVRQGKPLAGNLRARLENRSLRSYRPQKNYLSLIGTGNESAVASYGAIGFEWRGLWTIKDRIDQAFMNRFRQLPAMNETIADSADQIATAMRCLGCGAKVGSTTLDRVLRRIASPAAASVLVGLEAPDDAAVVQIPANQVLVQTIDYFPALVNDPFLFGQISTNHSLSDLFAMGATPQSALAIATLPYAVESKQEETLYQLLSGSLKILQQAGASLIGGHTIEGSTLAFGLACNGIANPNRLLRKSGMQPGNVLILTKAIGTGTLFAAAMRHETTARSIDSAIASMLVSNQDAATCFLNYGATACTDVTGFGLLGHLTEMIRASKVAVKLELSSIPILEGARESVGRGILSSLHPQNLRARHWIENESAIASHPDFALLFDPQTSGGLLASVPADRAIACLAALHAAGYTESAIVGHVLPDFHPAITIVK